MADTQAEVKRFVAPNMSRALELVRDEMGPEAVILSSQKVPGGVEIVTSIERDLPTRGIAERRDFGQNFDTEFDRAMESDVSWQTQAGIDQAAAHYDSKIELNATSEHEKPKLGEGLAAEIERARERMLEAKRRAAEGKAPIAPRQNNSPGSSSQHPSATGAREEHPLVNNKENEKKLQDLQGEIADLRMMLEQQLWSQRPAEREHNAYAVEEPAAPNTHIVGSHLERLGLTKELCGTLQQGIKRSARVSDAWKQSLAQLAKRIPIANDMDTSKGGVFAFIGPTGVGKTTTLAKLASQFTLANGPGKVALVSMDTHRVGAVEQLKALGRILDAPVRHVSASSSLTATVAELRKFPLVLIDTAGFRHGDAMLKVQLAQLDQNPAIKRLLVLSSVSQLQTLKASIHAYRPRANCDACVISKLDEASSLGEAITAVIQHALQVAYVTDGQEIPKDAHLATAHKIVSSAVALVKSASESNSASI